jgi:P27 family predicted phage terminase small subunit
MRGRHPKPGVIRQLEGNRSRTPIPNQATGLGEPVINPDLSPDEQRFWYAIVDSLPPGLLSRADEQALERAAVAWARFWECRKLITQLGMIVRGPNGPVRNPLLIVERDAREELHRAGEVLGLSPVARARIVTSDGQPGDDPLAVLMGGIESGAWSDNMGGDTTSNVVPLPRQRLPKKK